MTHGRRWADGVLSHMSASGLGSKGPVDGSATLSGSRAGASISIPRAGSNGAGPANAGSRTGGSMTRAGSSSCLTAPNSNPNTGSRAGGSASRAGGSMSHSGSSSHLTDAEARDELATKNNALRSMGKQLLALRDELTREAAAREAAQVNRYIYIYIYMYVCMYVYMYV